MRRRKIDEARSKLQSNLFILSPLICRSLIELRRLCLTIVEDEQYMIFHVESDVTYCLEDFCSKQSQQKDEVTTKFQNISNSIRTLVRQTCDQALEEFLNDNGFVNEDKEGAEGGGSSSPRREKRRSIVMRSTNGPREISFTERAAMRTQCRRLAKYIRLCDFFVLDTFLSVSLVCTKDLLTFINPPSLEGDDATSLQYSELLQVQTLTIL